MRLVVLATGTAIGKTALCRELVSAIQSPECPVLPLKPIETGFQPLDGGEPVAGSDAALLEAVAFHVKHPRPHPRYAFPDGISPHLAAEHAGLPLSLDEVTAWVSKAEQGAGGGKAPFTVIETAGGVFSPLSLGTSNFDLATALKAQLWLLVAPNRLGVLHDVGATLLGMTHRGRLPDALVLAPSVETDASTASNAQQLRRLYPALPIIELARHAAPGAVSPQLQAWLASQRLP